MDKCNAQACPTAKTLLPLWFLAPSGGEGSRGQFAKAGEMHIALR